MQAYNIVMWKGVEVEKGNFDLVPVQYIYFIYLQFACSCVCVQNGRK